MSINRRTATPFHCIGKVVVTLTKRERAFLVNLIAAKCEPGKGAKLRAKLERA